MADCRARVRSAIRKHLTPGIQSETEARTRIESEILASNIPLIAGQVIFLPGSRFAEFAVLINGRSVCVEIFAKVREIPEEALVS